LTFQAINFSVLPKSYSRNASCALDLISTFSLLAPRLVDYLPFHYYHPGWWTISWYLPFHYYHPGWWTIYLFINITPAGGLSTFSLLSPRLVDYKLISTFSLLSALLVDYTLISTFSLLSLRLVDY